MEGYFRKAKRQHLTSEDKGVKRVKASREKEDGEDGEDVHAPLFIYRQVKYTRRVHEKTSVRMKKTVGFIEDKYVVPVDFEEDHKFGPHAGLCYSTRLIRAYSLGLLALKDPTTEPEQMCVTCASLGHTYKACPHGF